MLSAGVGRLATGGGLASRAGGCCFTAVARRLGVFAIRVAHARPACRSWRAHFCGREGEAMLRRGEAAGRLGSAHGIVAPVHSKSLCERAL